MWAVTGYVVDDQSWYRANRYHHPVKNTAKFSKARSSFCIVAPLVAVLDDFLPAFVNQALLDVRPAFLCMGTMPAWGSLFGVAARATRSIAELFQHRLRYSEISGASVVGDALGVHTARSVAHPALERLRRGVALLSTVSIVSIIAMVL